MNDPPKRNKAETFSNLYDIEKKNAIMAKGTHLKADRNVMQSLVCAYASGRTVDLSNIVQHELMSAPISLAETSGSLRTGNQALLAECLTETVDCSSHINANRSSLLLIDGQALIFAMGKPESCRTFGDSSDNFIHRVHTLSFNFDRIDIVFDRYNHQLDSVGQRQHVQFVRLLKAEKFHYLWSNFISLSENKSNLTAFLSNEQIMSEKIDKTVVVAGGFVDEMKARSNDGTLILDCFKAAHKEADTRLVLHAINNEAENIVVLARDTDVLLLLLFHMDKITNMF